eukprot:123959-Hanusia_phi.AAC.1
MQADESEPSEGKRLARKGKLLLHPAAQHQLRPQLIVVTPPSRLVNSRFVFSSSTCATSSPPTCLSPMPSILTSSRPALGAA